MQILFELVLSLLSLEIPKLFGKQKKYMLARPAVNRKCCLLMFFASFTNILIFSPTDYARSFEKYMMKQRNWVASGDNGAYDNFNFLER